ncbi:MAG: hypothetical protein GC146_02615 [Limimaricola sp.]|uniref:hypothetical protein n=1 Tax=Limimaricola sp. TaxID=2211665 RepID=UPI001D5ABA1E|nr:hypothetical protein [Limimaricola sp.]MBI1416092.1 hypothetical protein [Limimaricola sp.]
MPRRPALLATALALALGLTGCAAPPRTMSASSAAAEAAPFPALVPLDPLLVAAGQPRNTPPVAAPDLSAPILARVSALRARAASLRAPAIDAATLARIRAGIDTTALQ